MVKTMRWSGSALLAAVLTASASGPSLAASPADPAQAAAGAGAASSAGRPSTGPAALVVVRDFYEALFDSMGHANARHMQGRYDHLYPVVIRLFDVPAMTRIALGRSFGKLDPDQQAALCAAFGALLVATVASTFDRFKGQVYRVEPDVMALNQNKLVKSRVNGPGAPVRIDYILSGQGDDWHVLDIVLDGSSQIASWRSEYGATFERGGFDGLTAAVRAQIDKDMKAF